MRKTILIYLTVLFETFDPKRWSIDNKYKAIQILQKNVILKNIPLFLLTPLGVKVAKHCCIFKI